MTNKATRKKPLPTDLEEITGLITEEDIQDPDEDNENAAKFDACEKIVIQAYKEVAKQLGTENAQWLFELFGEKIKTERQLSAKSKSNTSSKKAPDFNVVLLVWQILKTPKNLRQNVYRAFEIQHKMQKGSARQAVRRYRKKYKFITK